MLTFYKFISFFFHPFYFYILKYRQENGKELQFRKYEKLGFTNLKRPTGKLIWMHAASVGESIAIIPLIELLKAKEDVTILLTTCTVTSAEVIKKRLGDKIIHQFAPFDTIIAARRFLNHWKPDLAIWTESEIWPIVINETAKICKVYLVNARLSDHSYNRWKYFPSFIKKVLSNFTLILAESKFSEENFKRLSPKNVRYVGNLKFAADSLPVNLELLNELQTQTNDRLIFIASSTHHPEEEIIVDLHKKLKEFFPNLLTIIIPRDVKRGTEFGKILAGLKFSIRSLNQDITPNTDIYIADTMGELGLFYSLSNLSFVGGSFADVGGHNIIEPAKFANPIIIGPLYYNFKEAVNLLEKANGIVIAKDKDELFLQVKSLLEDKIKSQQLAINAKHMTDSANKILEQVYDYLFKTQLTN